jgi:hypothetical protein
MTHIIVACSSDSSITMMNLMLIANRDLQNTLRIAHLAALFVRNIKLQKTACQAS